MQKDNSLKSERKKQNFEAMEPSKKIKNVIRKKGLRNTANNLELQNKGAKQCKTMEQQRIKIYIKQKSI